MNPFERPATSAPDFVDPADIIVGPWAGSGAEPVADDQRPSSDGKRRSSAQPVTRAKRASAKQRTAKPPPDREDPDADPYDVARAIVLKQLTGAPRSRKQLADKLRQRGCDDGVAAVVLDRMEEVGLVDDAKYAETLVRSKQSGRGLARRAIAQELRRQGVDDEVINEQLDSIDEHSERDRARALADKKLRSMHGLDVQVQTRRLAGMLARKGYSSSMSWAVIREVIADAPEHQPD